MERKRSKLWNFFSEEADNKAKCDLCKSVYSVKGGSTTNLQKHMSTKHVASFNNLFPSNQSEVSTSQQERSNNNDQESKSVAGSSNSQSVTFQEPPKKKTNSDINFCQETYEYGAGKKSNGLVLNLIIKDLQPFSIVEDSGFKDLMTCLEPNYKIPSRSFFSTNMLDTQFTVGKENLKKELKRASYISLTTDRQTSRAETSYQAVTAHYILEDIWELQSALLGCFECHERHTAEYIKKRINKYHY